MEYFFERVGRAFSFIWEAVKMAFRDKDLLIPSLMSLVATAAYVAVLMGALYATDSLWLVGIERSELETLGRISREGVKSPVASIEERIAQMEADARAGRLSEDEAAGAATRGVAAAPDTDAAIAPADDAPSPAVAGSPRRTDSRNGKGQERWRTYVQLGFDVAAVFVGFVITYFFMGMTISLVYDHLSGKDARIGEAFALALKRAPAIVVLAATSTAVQLVASLARDRKGRDTLVSSAIEKAWTVASFLILPAMIIEDFSMWKAVNRAKEIVSKNLLVVAVGEVAVGLVANVIAMLGIVSGVVTGFLIYRAMPAPIYLPLGAGGVIVVLAIAFTGYVKVAYYTCLYVNAVESARLRKRAPLPEPLAAALA